MEAPDKMFVPTRFRLVDALRVRENDTDEEYIRKDALLEWLENKTKELPDSFVNGLTYLAYKEVIDKLKSM